VTLVNPQNVPETPIDLANDEVVKPAKEVSETSRQAIATIAVRKGLTTIRGQLSAALKLLDLDRRARGPQTHPG
jgi:hypothetical protein